MTDRGEPLAELDADKAPPPPRGDPRGLVWTSRLLRFDELGIEIDSVVCDGHEPDSAIVLHTNRSHVVIPGTTVLLNGTRLQATLTAALHYGAPKLAGGKLQQLANVVLGLASVREIHSSEHAAFDWGMSYVAGSQATAFEIDVPDAAGRERRWNTVRKLRDEARLAKDDDSPPPAQVLALPDGDRLVVRPWFHRHVRDIAPKADRLSEQRVASLMRLVGWQAYPSARSVLTVRNPADLSESIQWRLYVVPAGWEDTE